MPRPAPNSGLKSFLAEVVFGRSHSGRNPHRAQRQLRLAPRSLPGNGCRAPDARRAVPRGRRSRRAVRCADPPRPGRQRHGLIQPGLLLDSRDRRREVPRPDFAEPDFNPLVYNVDTTNRKATPQADLPLGLLYWRVAGTDGSSGIGPFTEATFTKEWGNAPTIDSPIDGATFELPEPARSFDWQPLAGAKSYTLEIDDESGFNLAASLHDKQHELHADRAARRSTQISSGGSEPRPQPAASSATGHLPARTRTRGRRYRHC